MKSQEFSLCPLEEIKKERKPQGVTDVKRVSIKRDNKIIHTNTYIMTFELPIIPRKMKIGYTMERVEQFIPNPLRCYKCLKYGHHEGKCNGKSVCGKCGQKDPDHSIEECKNTQRCANWGGPPGICKNMRKWKKERETFSIKYTRNISFLEARKIVDATSRDKTYSQAVASPTHTEATNEYLNLVKKLLQLGPDDWPNLFKNIRSKLEESMVKTKDQKELREEKGIKVASTQPDTSTQNKNTKTNNEKPFTDCTEDPRKIVLTRNQ